jgi:hypothetical protein
VGVCLAEVSFWRSFFWVVGAAAEGDWGGDPGGARGACGSGMMVVLERADQDGHFGGKMSGFGQLLREPGCV